MKKMWQVTKKILDFLDLNTAANYNYYFSKWYTNKASFTVPNQKSKIWFEVDVFYVYHSSTISQTISWRKAGAKLSQGCKQNDRSVVDKKSWKERQRALSRCDEITIEWFTVWAVAINRDLEPCDVHDW